MSSHPALDPQVLSHILLLHSSLSAAPDEQRLAGMIVHNIHNLTIVEDCALCLEGHLSLPGAPEPIPCTTQEGRWLGCDANCATSCRFRTEKGWLRIPLQSSHKEYGSLYLQSANQKELSRYLPFLQNSGNLIVLWLENSRIQKVLSDANILLDQQVKKRSEQLHESGEYQRQTLHSIGDGVIVTDAEGRVTTINRVAETLTGWSEAEGTGRELEEIFPIISEKDRTPVKNPVDKVLRDGEIVGLANHTLLVSRNGQEIPIADSAAPIRMNDDTISGVVLVFRDQTAERQAQQLTQSRLDLLAYGVDHSLDDLIQKALDVVSDLVDSPIGFYHFVDDDQKNLALQQWSSRTLKEFCTAEGKGSHYPIDKAGVWVDCVRLGRPVIHNDYPSLPHKKGLPKGHPPVIRELVVPVMREEKIVAIMGVGNKPTPYSDQDLETVSFIADVTWQIILNKRIEEQLRSSARQWSITFDAVGDVIWLLDINQRVIRTNRAVESVLGLSPSQVLWKSCHELVHDSNYPITRCPLKKARQTLSRASTELETEHGWFLITVDPILDENGEYSGAVHSMRDITKRKQAEADRELLRKAVEQAVEGIFITDAQNRILYVNQGLVRLTGYMPEQLRDKTPGLFRTDDHDHDFFINLKEDIYRGKPWQGYRKVKRQQGDIIEVFATISPIVGENGKINHFVSVYRDVSRERQAERRIQQFQRMEAIGTLAGGIAHDFNNILSPIMGYTEICLTNTSPGSQLHDDLEQIALAAQRAKGLVKQILSFSRQTDTEKTSINLDPIIKEALKLLRAAIPASIRIDQGLETSNHQILADPTEIHQVIMNLCTNAQHAMGETGGVLAVKTRIVELDTDFCRSHPEVTPGTFLRLSVEDTGHGIPQEIREKIFDPYFTTKIEGKGTGLGLATVHSIVQECNGCVTLYSEEGKGTRFCLYFPVLENRTQQNNRDLETFSSPRGKGCILFVDDELSVARLGCRILERLGYTVESFTKPVEALDRLKSEPNQFDMLVTDMTMPGMNGDNLAQEAKRLRQQLPVILCTGFSEKLEELKKNPLLSAVILKPFDSRELADKVHELLVPEESSTGPDD